MEIEFITYEIATFITVMYYLYRINKNRKVEKEEEINQIVRRVIESELFQDKLKESVKQGIDESDYIKKLDALIILLCTYVPELKKSRLCNP